ncbi:hypothetical protein AVEN_185049-1 [Araneus ventricosus]|uniref:Uncharacterized protein n=1 Tax=Araneus ventricosus TaxID=182803 RepID=A0A4Y2BPE1_ARAVE|nr:hypothetical protein AVEN_185049-1 [Araneus ventricosus]
MLEEWQISCNNGDTGREYITSCPQLVSVPLTGLEWMLASSLNMVLSLSTPPQRFHLSDSDQCSCGGTGTALNYSTECVLTVSWHMRRPVPNFEQEWLKRMTITSSPCKTS